LPEIEIAPQNLIESQGDGDGDILFQRAILRNLIISFVGVVDDALV